MVGLVGQRLVWDAQRLRWITAGITVFLSVATFISAFIYHIQVCAAVSRKFYNTIHEGYGGATQAGILLLSPAHFIYLYV